MLQAVWPDGTIIFPKFGQIQGFKFAQYNKTYTKEGSIFQNTK